MKKFHFTATAIYTLLLSLCTLLMTGCSDDAPEQPTPFVSLEIVTIVNPEPPALMLSQRTDASPVRTLRTDAGFSNAEAGQRILLYYKAAVADTVLDPVPVNIISAGAIPWGDVPALPLGEILPKAMSGFKILSTWRTGNYLNMQISYPTNAKNTTYTLVADRETLGQDTVVCYLSGQDMPAPGEYVDRRGYGSFDVSSILTRPGQSIKITDPAK